MTRGIKKLKVPKAEKPDTRRVLKTAIYYDPCGSMSQTTEEQIAADVKHFNGQYGPFDGKFTLKPYQIHDTRGIQPGTDLVLFDYGGMGFGNDLMYCHSRYILQWAIDNPNTLIIVTSCFTYDIAIKHELRELGFENLPNVIEQMDLIPEWFFTSTAASVPEKREQCVRCKEFFGEESNAGTVKRTCTCGAVVGLCCWDGRQRTCGACAGWDRIK